ncbi:MAG TPA: DUF58 domain-containing protein [Acidimicrobiales bacterium]
MNRRRGAAQLTPLGAAALLLLLVLLAAPPPGLDPELTAVVWTSVVGVLVVGSVWPLIAIRSVSARVEAPLDAQVGDHSPVTIELDGRCRGLAVRLLDPASPWRRATTPGGGGIPHRATHRGAFDALRIELRTTAPLGVLTARRVLQVQLRRPVLVAPRPLAVEWHPQGVPNSEGTDAQTSARLGGDVVRSVRPYVTGDPAHLVHWPSSARLGALVVRELEPPSPRGQAIVVDLRGPPQQAEVIASYAAGAVIAVLAAGGQVSLSTCERTGPVTAPVASAREAGRRLARSVPGPPGEPPDGWSVVELGSPSGHNGPPGGPLALVAPRLASAAPGTAWEPRPGVRP